MGSGLCAARRHHRRFNHITPRDLWDNNSLFPCEQVTGCAASRAAFCYGNGSVGDDVKETPIRSGARRSGSSCTALTSVCWAALAGNTLQHLITQEFGEVEGKAGGGLVLGLQMCSQVLERESPVRCIWSESWGA